MTFFRVIVKAMLSLCCFEWFLPGIFHQSENCEEKVQPAVNFWWNLVGFSAVLTAAGKIGLFARVIAVVVKVAVGRLTERFGRHEAFFDPLLLLHSSILKPDFYLRMEWIRSLLKVHRIMINLAMFHFSFCFKV